MGVGVAVPSSAIYVAEISSPNLRGEEALFVSSVRSSNSHPDLLVTQHQHPLFQITPVLNTGLSLSEPLQLYQGQSLDSSAGYMYTL